MNKIKCLVLSLIASCFLSDCAENATIGQVILHNQTDGKIIWSSTAISANEDYWSSVSIDGRSFGWVMSRLLSGRVTEIMIEDFVKNLDDAEVIVTMTKSNGEALTRTWRGSDRTVDPHTPFNPRHCERSSFPEVNGRNHIVYDFYVTEEDFMSEFGEE